MSDEYDYLFKSIVVGDGGVGKTALTLRFSKGFFTEDYKMTIGVDFHVKTIKIDTAEGPLRCKLQIWDTGGQERFSSIRPMYYRGSLGALLIFDLTSYESFEHLPQWIEEVSANIKNDIPLLLVGNKSDLIDERAVSIEELNEFTGKFNMYYMDTSAKTGEGVGDCFAILASLMIGSGVPEEFLNGQVVYSPGQIGISEASVPTIKAAPVSIPKPAPVAPIIEPEPEFEFAAPPVPEPTPVSIPKPAPVAPLEEPEIEFEFSAPPVPEPVPVRPVAPEPIFSSEPKNSIPEPEPEAPIDFDFKTPDQILSKKSAPAPIFSPVPAPPDTSEIPVYQPKAIPFSDNIPVPAPAPDGFSNIKTKAIEEPPKSTAAAPFLLSKAPEKPKPKPASMTFEKFDEPTIPSSSPIFPMPFSEKSSQKEILPFSKPVESDSLVDYMPETILSKKDKKKLEKEKKKEEKERAKLEKEQKIQEAKERYLKEVEEKKEQKKKGKEKPKKEKSEDIDDWRAPEMDVGKPAPSKISKPPSLFDSLSSTKSEEVTSSTSSSPFVPFMPTKKSDTEVSSTLRIIPNIADIESETPSIPIPSQTEEKKSKRTDMIICNQCGAMLSSDYAFCNKCGSKL